MAQFSYLVGFVGADADRSLGLELHEREAHRHGLRYLCRRVDADARAFRAQGLGGFLRACRDFGFSGLDVARPYRHRVVPYVDELSETAARVGSVDVIVFTRDGRTVGHNTDVAGCVAALLRGLPGVPLDRVVQVGAGDAGIAAAYALRERGVRHLSVTDPVPERARALVECLNQGDGAAPGRAEAFPAEGLAERLKQADGLVNSLPTDDTDGTGGAGGGDGADGREVVRPEFLRGDLWIFDTRYHPDRTPLVRAGSALGCRVLQGGGALVHEAATAFRLVTGRTPHTSSMFGDFADLTAGPQAHT
ncbi:shikimate dehydrogenase [Streptomyces maremycinicus]|uniref:shikimate dehydrogenase n=1 Tax=Streptomyces maremycinicus TaxID=1679753 RepID=UPI00078802FE|nr:shikimate dehydrogenase [Streptomyces sp. NBRC 110468]